MCSRVLVATLKLVIALPFDWFVICVIVSFRMGGCDAFYLLYWVMWVGSC